MTDEMMTLRGLVEKPPDADLLREMIGVRRRAADGAGGGRPDRRARGEKSPDRLVQRTAPRPGLGDAGRNGRTCASRGCAAVPVLPRFPRARHGRESADRRHPGSLHPRRIDPLGRRPRKGAWHEWGVEEPGDSRLCTAHDRLGGASRAIAAATGGSPKGCSSSSTARAQPLRRTTSPPPAGLACRSLPRSRARSPVHGSNHRRPTGPRLGHPPRASVPDRARRPFPNPRRGGGLIPPPFAASAARLANDNRRGSAPGDPWPR